MDFCRKVFVLGVLSVCGLLMLTSASAGELEKWIPGDAALYGKISGKVVRESALFKRLLQKYPDFNKYIQQGRQHIGNYQGDLDEMMFVFSPVFPGAALFMEFSQPYSQEAVAAGLAAKGLAGNYEKITVAGKNGYVLTKPTPQGRSCFVMLSDRVMLGCLENAAEAALTASPISGDLLKKLQSSSGADVFLQVFPGNAEMLQGASVQKFDMVGRLAGDVLKLDCRVKFPDEQTAQNTEIQIRQGMAMMLGLAFADDAELGMALYSRIKVKRKKNDISVKASLSADLIERLVNYSCTQIEKKKQAKSVQRARRKTGAPAVQ